MLNLKNYKPDHPEAAVFLQDISDFLDMAMTAEETAWLGPSGSRRLQYEYADTLPGSTAVMENYAPDSLYVKGLALLRNFHKLWTMNWEKFDIMLDFHNSTLLMKVAGEVIYGIGGELTYCPPTPKGALGLYQLTANGVVFSIVYDQITPHSQQVDTRSATITVHKVAT